MKNEENYDVAGLPEVNNTSYQYQSKYIADNGSIVSCKNEDSIYLIQRGRRHLVPNARVFYNLFKGHELIQYLKHEELNSIPLGEALSEDALLIRADHTPPVYLYSNRTKSYIRSAKDFDIAGFDWGKIKSLPQKEVEAIPTVRDFIVEKKGRITILNNEIPSDYDSDNNYGYLTHFTCQCTERKVTCNILLPTERCEKDYPVLYLYHGLGSNSEWIRSYQGRIRQIIGNMVSKKLIPEMVVVMPDMMYSGEATKAYDFYRFKTSLKGLMSFVEMNYNVKKGKENTAIAGLSFGGATALYDAYLLKDTFQYVGAFCPASILLYQPDRGILDSWISRNEKFELGTDGKSFIYIATGTSDCSVKGTPEYYSKVLRENGTDNIFSQLSNAGHDWDTFKKLFYVFMSFDFFRKQ